MTIKELLEAQAELDKTIIRVKQLENLNPKVRLTNTLLALMVEVGELANEVRSFKAWSNKPMSPKEIVLDEMVDVLHFYLSLANQLGFTEDDLLVQYKKKNQVNVERQNNGY